MGRDVGCRIMGTCRKGGTTRRIIKRELSFHSYVFFSIPLSISVDCRDYFRYVFVRNYCHLIEIKTGKWGKKKRIDKGGIIFKKNEKINE